MAKSIYDVVHYWIGGRECGEWVTITPPLRSAPDSAKVALKAVKEGLEKQGYVALLGKSTIGAPEGAPKRRRFEDIGVFLPTRSEIESLAVGNLAPDCFGNLRTVVEISFRGIDINGRAYVGYTTWFGANSTVSNSLKEGRILRHTGLNLTSAAIDALEEQAEARRPTAKAV